MIPSEKEWNLAFWSLACPLAILGTIVSLFLRFLAGHLHP